MKSVIKIHKELRLKNIDFEYTNLIDSAHWVVDLTKGKTDITDIDGNISCDIYYSSM